MNLTVRIRTPLAAALIAVQLCAWPAFAKDNPIIHFSLPKGFSATVLVDGLDMPNGIAFLDGALYVAEARRIIRFPDIENRIGNPGNPEVIAGYRISVVRLKGNEAISYEPFMTGFLGGDGQVFGRPVDLLIAPDGALLVSDDKRGVIYRVAYHADN